MSSIQASTITPGGHIFLPPATQVAVAAATHYPYRFNPTATISDNAAWYSPSMMSNNGSVFTPGFKGKFQVTWTIYQVSAVCEAVIAKNNTMSAAFDNSNSGSTLAYWGNYASAANGVTSLGTTLSVIFNSNSATDYLYFGLYNANSSNSVTFQTTRTGARIQLLSYNV